MTPEQIVADWIGVSYNPNWTEVQELIAAIQSYGAACAAVECERVHTALIKYGEFEPHVLEQIAWVIREMD